MRLHVAAAGPEDGPVVVLLHGWPQHWWLWREQLPALAAAGRRALAFDLRGYGWSTAPATGYDKEQFAADVLAALDTLGVGRFGVVGHDWGGWTAQLLAHLVPDRVQRMALLNMAPLQRRPGAALRNLVRFAYQVPLVLPLLGPRVHRPFTRRLPGVDRAAREVYAAPFAEPARARAATATYRAYHRVDLPRVASGRYAGLRLPSPLLVLHGTGDPVIRPAMVEGFRELADDVDIEYVPHTGHFIADERPELVSQRLVAHFA